MRWKGKRQYDEDPSLAVKHDYMHGQGLTFTFLLAGTSTLHGSRTPLQIYRTRGILTVGRVAAHCHMCNLLYVVARVTGGQVGTERRGRLIMSPAVDHLLPLSCSENAGRGYALTPVGEYFGSMAHRLSPGSILRPNEGNFGEALR